MKPTLALSMIVRDAAADLPNCLASAQGVVDEIVVADTGSGDDSMAVARACGARVIAIPWRDDFAAARNESLAACRSDWVLMLDADERLDPEAGPAVRGLMSATPDYLGYEATIRNYVPSLGIHMYTQIAQPNDGRLAEAQPYPAYVEHANVRLFRRHKEIYFTGCVHETTGRRIEALGQKVGPPGFVIHHFGLARGGDRGRRDRYYRELGRKKLAESPDDPRGYFELGAEALEQLGDAAEALPLFQRACELAPGFWLAWFYRGQAHLRLGQSREALQAFAIAREGGLTGTHFAAATGEAHYALGEFAAAAHSFRRGLKMQPESATLASHLAMCEIRGGEAEAGLKRMRRAVRAEPENWAIQDRLISALAWLGQITAAAEAAEAALARYPEPNAKAYLRAASLRARAEQWAQAAAVLRPGIQRFPENAALRAACSEVQAHLSPPLSQKPLLEG